MRPVLLNGRRIGNQTSKSDPTERAWPRLSGEWPTLNTFAFNGHKAIEAAANPADAKKWDFLKESGAASQSGAASRRP